MFYLEKNQRELLEKIKLKKSEKHLQKLPDNDELFINFKFPPSCSTAFLSAFKTSVDGKLFNDFVRVKDLKLDISVRSLATVLLNRLLTVLTPDIPLTSLLTSPSNTTLTRLACKALWGLDKSFAFVSPITTTFFVRPLVMFGGVKMSDVRATPPLVNKSETNLSQQKLRFCQVRICQLLGDVKKVNKSETNLLTSLTSPFNTTFLTSPSNTTFGGVKMSGVMMSEMPFVRICQLEDALLSENTPFVGKSTTLNKNLSENPPRGLKLSFNKIITRNYSGYYSEWALCSEWGLLRNGDIGADGDVGVYCSEEFTPYLKNLIKTIFSISKAFILPKNLYDEKPIKHPLLTSLNKTKGFVWDVLDGFFMDYFFGSLYKKKVLSDAVPNQHDATNMFLEYTVGPQVALSRLGKQNNLLLFLAQTNFKIVRRKLGHQILHRMFLVNKDDRIRLLLKRNAQPIEGFDQFRQTIQETRQRAIIEKIERAIIEEIAIIEKIERAIIEYFKRRVSQCLKYLEIRINKKKNQTLGKIDEIFEQKITFLTSSNKTTFFVRSKSLTPLTSDISFLTSPNNTTKGLTKNYVFCQVKMSDVRRDVRGVTNTTFGFGGVALTDVMGLTKAKLTSQQTEGLLRCQSRPQRSSPSVCYLNKTFGFVTKGFVLDVRGMSGVKPDVKLSDSHTFTVRTLLSHAIEMINLLNTLLIEYKQIFNLLLSVEKIFIITVNSEKYRCLCETFTYHTNLFLKEEKGDDSIMAVWGGI